MAVKIPGSGSTSNARLKRIYSVAQNTASIEVNVYNAGSAHTPGTGLLQQDANIGSGSSDCGTSDSFGNRTCTITIGNVPVGLAVDFVFTTYDGWNGTTHTGNAIGAGVDPNQTIAANTTPTIAVTLNSILSSVSLGTVPSVIHSLIPTPVTLDVYALDADNDVIVSNAYTDANGNAETISISESGAETNGASTPLNGSLTFNAPNSGTSTSLGAPAPNGLAMTYSGGAYDNGSPLTLSASVSPTTTTVNSTALTVVYPSFTSVSDSNLTATGSFHGGAGFITISGSTYFIYTTQNNAVDSYQLGSPPVTQGGTTTAAGYFGGLAIPNASEMYFVAQNGLATDVVPPSYNNDDTACSSSCPPGNESGLGYDATNNLLYYTSGTNLVRYNITSATTASLNVGVVSSGGVAVDKNSNIWLVQTGSNASLLMVGSSFTSSTPIGLSTSSQPFDVVVAGNGDIVVSDKEYDQLWVFDSSGSQIAVDSMPGYLPCCANTPWYLAADPAQPDVVWFDYTGNGSIGIGRLNLSTNQISAETFVSGPNAGQPGALAVDSSGGVAMVYDGTSSIVEVQP